MKLHEYYYLEQLKTHFSRKMYLLEAIKHYPEGWLVIHKKGNRQCIYLHKYTNGKRSQKYLSVKKDRNLISALQKKKTELPALKEELAFRKKALVSMRTQAKKILKKTKLHLSRGEPFFSENTIEPKQLKYTTNRGEKVRSKTEKIIADLLYQYHIDYKYEKALKLTYYKEIFPDFTILSPLNGQTYYWEHNGLNTEEYLERWDTKKQIYENSNINTGNYLIVTTEEDIDDFQKIIEENFTLKRYSFIETL